VERFASLAAVIRDANPADKAEIYKGTQPGADLPACSADGSARKRTSAWIPMRLLLVSDGHVHRKQMRARRCIPSWEPAMTAPRVISLSSDAMDLNVCADSFAEFLYRFWIENEIFFALHGNRPLPPPTTSYQARLTPPCHQPITTLICAPQPMIAETSATEQNGGSARVGRDTDKLRKVKLSRRGPCGRPAESVLAHAVLRRGDRRASWQ
jgi:hypothetical protein